MVKVPESITMPDDEFLSDEFFSSKSDKDLAAMMHLIIGEQQKRALEGAEPDALLEQGFKDGFKPNGLPHDPWIVEGILICPGAVNDRSTTSHDCGFVAFDEHWCWEHPDVLLDDIRYIDGPKRRQRSVSLIPVFEGLEFDLVISRASAGQHKMRSATAFRVVDSCLEVVRNRTPKKRSGHRH
jgi:hypothetical protein